ncbi:MAG TPA: hypothetical protein VN541_20380 [Tepidisphaeraceae bacterium]|nr:hypothetical protein [Tepidisphaeraceae bacterium]
MDNTIVALFERPQEADAVRQDLIHAGLSDKNVTVICELPLKEKPKGVGKSLLSWFGQDADEEPRCCVSVYDEPENVRRAAQIIERHHPRDVKKHATAA